MFASLHSTLYASTVACMIYKLLPAESCLTYVYNTVLGRLVGLEQYEKLLRNISSREK